MKSFKTKTLDAPTLYRSSSKIKKLKKMLADRKDDVDEDEDDEVEETSKKEKKKKRRKETSLAVYEGGRSLAPKRDEDEAVLVVKKRFDPEDFDPKSMLHNELMEVVDLLETARSTYRDLPDGENASSLSMLLREMRGFVGDLYQMTQEDKDTLYKKLEEEILQPFLRKLVKGVITELDSARRQLVMSFGEDRSTEVTAALKSAGRNMSATFSQEYASLMKEVAKSLDVEGVQPIMDRLNNIHFQGSTPGPQKKEDEP